MNDTSPTIGHNLPAPYVPESLDAAEIQRELEAHNQDLLDRYGELLAGLERFDAAVGATISDDETLTRTGAFILQLRDCAKEANARREAAKAPYLEGGAAVDGFFKAGISAPLEQAIARLAAMQTSFNNAKAARIRAEAQAKARAEAEEADRRRREAEAAEREKRKAEIAAAKAKNDAERAEAQRQAAEAKARADAAREEQERALVAESAAAETAKASAADLTRTRGDLALTTTRTIWKFEIEDLSKVPLAYLTINTPVVLAAIKGDRGLRSIPGIRIFAEHVALNRR
jgi:hypothetical protein